MEQPTKNVAVIKEFFESGVHGRKVEIAELKALTMQERQELGDMCREALGK